jgi:hypothetical protein
MSARSDHLSAPSLPGPLWSRRSVGHTSGSRSPPRHCDMGRTQNPPTSCPECPTLGRSTSGHDATPRGPPRSADDRCVVRSMDAPDAPKLQLDELQYFFRHKCTNFATKTREAPEGLQFRRTRKGADRIAPVLFSFLTQRHESSRHQGVASRTTKHRQFGSAQGRISVYINRPASSACRRPVRKLGTVGSG